MSVKNDIACGKTIIQHFKEYGVTDYVWQRNEKKNKKLKSKIDGKRAEGVQFIMPSSRSGELTEDEISRSGKRFYDKPKGADFGVCDDFAAGVCYAILQDHEAGRWTSSSAELIQGGGHSYVICNRNDVDPNSRAKDQVNVNTFILDAWYWCLNCCGGEKVITQKNQVIAHLDAFHPSKVPANGSAREGGISCKLTIGANNRQNAAPVKRCCYLTTAACDVMGLPDDCDELVTLRWFRDNVLLETLEGQQEVEQYYVRAPRVIDALNQLDRSEQLYQSVYLNTIVPSVQLIKAGKFTEAHNLYKSMVDSFEQEYCA